MGAQVTAGVGNEETVGDEEEGADHDGNERAMLDDAPVHERELEGYLLIDEERIEDEVGSRNDE